MQARDRLIVALDYSTRDEVLRAVEELRGVVGVFKIGLQAFVANGPALVQEVVSTGERVFLDLKIHDIPNTAANAVAAVASLGVAMTTVHAAGGLSMLRACVSGSVVVLGVTILTSLDEKELRETGLAGTPLESAVRFARLAQAAGLGGVVASPREIAPIREACGAKLAIVTPGVRPVGADAGDQRRVMTPGEAIASGADYIVVGRPITKAADPRSAAFRIVEEMDL